uniref:Uncharacterized protein n=1 Tax=Oryza punctata TaxID=4537 RepID=A0A0E0LTS3_ORYPU
MVQQQQQHAAAGEHQLWKATKVNTSWDSCIMEHGSPTDSSPTILSFGGHAARRRRGVRHRCTGAEDLVLRSRRRRSLKAQAGRGRSGRPLLLGTLGQAEIR